MRFGAPPPVSGDSPPVFESDPSNSVATNSAATENRHHCRRRPPSGMIEAVDSDGHLRSCPSSLGGIGWYRGTKSFNRVASSRRIRILNGKGSRVREGNGYKLWRSDKIMAISVVIDGDAVNVISAYASHLGLSNADKKRFWDALDELEEATGRPRILWKNLKGEAVETFRANVSEKLSALEDIMFARNADQMWNTFADVIRDVAKDSLATKQSRFKELLACLDGIQEDIDLAKERYKAAKREAKIAVARAKDESYEDLCHTPGRGLDGIRVRGRKDCA
nr:hypothetical protein [Tanacetum cinerariifolium]